MKKRNELIAYALDFASYLISREDEIDRIMLFGSVARGDFDKESDIDLFIDSKDKKLEKEIEIIIDSYHKTQKSKNWEMKGISNPFSCIVGELDSSEWKDLKRGLVNNGIILYGKYKAAAEKINHYTLFSFGKIKPESRRVSFHRILFGFKLRKKKYLGLMEKYNSIKLGKGSILVPVEQAVKMKQFFKEKKVPVRVYDIWSDYSLS